ncbi:hypothetical protein [Paenibacillus nasutitermitis]|uniref:Uncharacterized protein n=1 Tax=Paenibacillus nasutitermitis TaxID=1652958 RepID=A0A916YWC6_9BACL|nr:hypothetical protein [Paenibacillus nasutitermitis]GGD64984.1 hypothetical protein GCM10010911_23440 [Paenibacillus nasutitermitis]
MGERVKSGLLILIYSLGAGLMLSLFSTFNSGFNIVFSLLALGIGILFFRKFPKIGSRIIFIVLSVFFFLLFVIIIAVINYAKTNPIQP